jgi:hypothetical protein
MLYRIVFLLAFALSGCDADGSPAKESSETVSQPVDLNVLEEERLCRERHPEYGDSDCSCSTGGCEKLFTTSLKLPPVVSDIPTQARRLPRHR